MPFIISRPSHLVMTLLSCPSDDYAFYHIEARSLSNAFLESFRFLTRIICTDRKSTRRGNIIRTRLRIVHSRGSTHARTHARTQTSSIRAFPLCTVCTRSIRPHARTHASKQTSIRAYASRPRGSTHAYKHHPCVHVRCTHTQFAH